MTNKKNDKTATERLLMRTKCLPRHCSYYGHPPGSWVHALSFLTLSFTGQRREMQVNAELHQRAPLQVTRTEDVALTQPPLILHLKPVWAWGQTHAHPFLTSMFYSWRWWQQEDPPVTSINRPPVAWGALSMPQAFQLWRQEANAVWREEDHLEKSLQPGVSSALPDTKTVLGFSLGVLTLEVSLS